MLNSEYSSKFPRPIIVFEGSFYSTSRPMVTNSKQTGWNLDEN